MNKKINEMKSKYGAGDNSSYDNEEKNSIDSNEQNAADTTKSNMFLDITNANHIGIMDNSLEDYYKRRILNNNTENRLVVANSTKYLKRCQRITMVKYHFSTLFGLYLINFLYLIYHIKNYLACNNQFYPIVS